LKPIRPLPALLLKRGSERILVLTDLHIGWEAALAKRGIHIPSQGQKILERIVHLIEREKPSSLILLGDVKHTVATAEWVEWREVTKLFESLCEIIEDIQVVPGNHDGNLRPMLPESVTITQSRGLALWKKIALFHGHTWPSLELMGCRTLIIGHVHPMVVFQDSLGFRIAQRVWVKAKCECKHIAMSILRHMNIKTEDEPTEFVEKRFNVKLKASQLLIMPAFNEFLGGYPMNLKTVRGNGESQIFISPILRSKGVDVNNAEIHLLDGTFLGSTDQLKTLDAKNIKKRN
jgi:hypothetical protein